MIAMRHVGLGLVLATAMTVLSGCREEGDVMVSSLRFEGVTAFDTGDLKNIIATRESGSLPWSPKYFFDRSRFEDDVKRIEAFYADAGFPEARVAGVDVDLNDAKDKVDIVVRISEGEPVIVERVEFRGLDGIPADHLERLRTRIPISGGERRDQRLILASHNMIVSELRDHGFPYGTVQAIETDGSAPRRVIVEFAAQPGTKAVFGPITIEGQVSVSEDVIRRELAFREGEMYQLSRLNESQRRLYGLELFQFANVGPELPEDGAPQVPIRVTVAEGKHRRLQLAAGYGSEEKIRGRINWRHVNFGGGARTGETEARWSSLEQGIRGTFVEPFLFQRGLSLRALASTWWSDEPIYESRSTGTRLIVAKDFSRTGFGADRGVHNQISVGLIREYKDYAISASALADPEFREELIALGLDPDTGRGKGTLSAFEIDFERTTSDQPLNPTRGYSVFAHVEKAGTLVGGSFTYNEYLAEVRTYLPIASRVIWAHRARAGTIAGSESAAIPFYKRYFVGGSNSVRGWGRYQVSPLSTAGLPIGGRTMLEVATEARFPIRGRMSGVLFLDGGNVWLEPWDLQVNDLRWAAGPGIRYDTPIGPVRFDLGVQLNPIAGLVIEGTPERRKWRVHFSIGQAF